MVSRAVKRRPVLLAFLVLSLAFTAAWGYDQRRTDQRTEERRRDTTTVCEFLNDTRFEVRGVIALFTTGNPTSPPLQLPPELAELVRASQAQTLERAKAAQARLTDYDCEAFLRGEVPRRGP